MSKYRLKLVKMVSSIKNWCTSWFRWTPTSSPELEVAEQKVLSYLKRPYKGYFVDIGQDWGPPNSQIWTIEMQASDKTAKTQMPLVLVHGFAAGVAFWVLNLDSLSSGDRKVYAFDVLGFGRSSRPQFDMSKNVELQIVQGIEKWRIAVGLDSKFILLGHSFGAYLALSYALHFPEKVGHLILADPWGIAAKPSDSQKRTDVSGNTITLPFWIKVVATVVQAFNPLAALRASGPWGPTLIQRIRPDLKRKFESLTGPDDSHIILNYAYHCNAQRNPSGEAAFKSLALPMAWARYPMIERVGDLDSGVDLTFIYGSKSWVDSRPGAQIKKQLEDRSVDIHIVQDAGHHVYADKHENFNTIVSEACQAADDRVQENDQQPDIITESIPES